MKKNNRYFFCVLHSLRLTNDSWIFIWIIWMFGLGEIVDCRHMPAYLYIFKTAKTLFGRFLWNSMTSNYGVRSSNHFYLILFIFFYYFWNGTWHCHRNSRILCTIGFLFQVWCMVHTRTQHTISFYLLYFVPSQCFFLLLLLLLRGSQSSYSSIQCLQFYSFSIWVFSNLFLLHSSYSIGSQNILSFAIDFVTAMSKYFDTMHRRSPRAIKS